ncbi:hypothetical protein DM01DRAFT_1304991 [Hesseltinella vesiculosa]|uniref:RNI-like protein n=1 Tax=Hesseltinella vesiculosa TaxID=101127 RepID=A0A1X2GJF8_9FUNG|nr:hypothetical protein DM01DRAFT_1304991 [Hesseltinella vesiculosa]
MDLAIEIQHVIISFIEQDQPTLLQLCLVSRSWYHATTIFLYKAPSFHLYSQLIRFAQSPHLHLVKTLNMQMIPHRWRLNMGTALLPILEQTNHVHRLDFGLCHQLQMPQLQATTSAYPIQSLSLHGLGNQVNDQVVEKWVTDHPDLLELDLSSCQITDASIYTIGNHCSKLVDLDLSGCEHISEDGIRHLTRHCQHIRHVNLQDCFNVVLDDDEVPDRSDDEFWQTDEEAD